MTKDKKPVRGTTATFKNGETLECDLERLAEIYLYVGNIPEHLSFGRACEIQLLSKAFLFLYKEHQKRKGELNK